MARWGDIAADRRRDWPALLALFLIATAYNLFKPYHIDDTAHVLIAQWIAGHPLHPMSGPLNWTGTDGLIAATNQPHLLFYLYAAWGSLFGFGEVAMHLLQSVFTGVAILLFHRLAVAVGVARPAWLTALLALNPAFLVEQNLMVDVPLLALWLGFFVALLTMRDAPRQGLRFGIAGAACAAAILVKYSSLVLLPLLAGAICGSGAGRNGGPSRSRSRRWAAGRCSTSWIMAGSTSSSARPSSATPAARSSC